MSACQTNDKSSIESLIYPSLLSAVPKTIAAPHLTTTDQQTNVRAELQLLFSESRAPPRKWTEKETNKKEKKKKKGTYCSS